MRMTGIDWGWIAVYGVASLALGVYFARRSGASTAEYFASGRSLPWWLAGTSMVATTFAADTPLAVTELVREHGVAGNWLWWSFAASGMLTVFLFARLWRRAEVLTDVELAELRYGGLSAALLRGFRALYLGAAVNSVVIGWVTTAMASIVMTAFGLDARDRLAVIAALMAVTALYATLGGLWGVVVTDAFQFVIAMGGAVALAVFALRSPEVGGLGGLGARLAAQGRAPALDFFPRDAAWMPWSAFAIYAGVQWWATWYPGAEPGGGGYVAQRMFAARDGRHALYATLWFNVAHYALRPWPWILVALASLVVMPGPLLDPVTHAPDPKRAYVLMMARYLPPGWRGLMLASFFAAYMSTLSTQMNWGGSYLVNDFYRRFVRRGADEGHYVRVARAATALAMVLGAAVAMAMERVTSGWELLLVVGAGTGPVYMLRWYWWRINAWSEVAAMGASLVLAAALAGLRGAGVLALRAPYDLPVVALASSVVWLAVTFATRPEDPATLERFYRRVRPGGPGWAPVAARAPDVVVDTALGRWALDALAGTGLVLGLLFGAGAALFGRYGAALAWVSLAVLCGGWILRDLARRGEHALRE